MAIVTKFPAKEDSSQKDAGKVREARDCENLANLPDFRHGRRIVMLDAHQDS